MNKDCGLCGCRTCEEFQVNVTEGNKSLDDCPYDQNQIVQKINDLDYDFELLPLPGEPSARKYIVPFRPDLVEKWEIKSGDIVLGRPAGAGCPVQHVLKVLSVNLMTAVIEGHVVGPQYSRDREVKDIQCYNMHAFEGLAKVVNKEPTFGLRQRFLPGFCMMNAVHTAVTMTVLNKSFGLHVRLEDIRFL